MICTILFTFIQIAVTKLTKRGLLTVGGMHAFLIP